VPSPPPVTTERSTRPKETFSTSRYKGCACRLCFCPCTFLRDGSYANPEGTLRSRRVRCAGELRGRKKYDPTGANCCRSDPGRPDYRTQDAGTSRGRSDSRRSATADAPARERLIDGTTPAHLSGGGRDRGWLYQSGVLAEQHSAGR